MPDVGLHRPNNNGRSGSRSRPLGRSSAGLDRVTQPGSVPWPSTTSTPSAPIPALGQRCPNHLAAAPDHSARSTHSTPRPGSSRSRLPGRESGARFAPAHHTGAPAHNTNTPPHPVPSAAEQKPYTAHQPPNPAAAKNPQTYLASTSPSTTSQRQRRLTRTQRLTRQMQRHQRRRTRRIHRHAAPPNPTHTTPDDATPPEADYPNNPKHPQATH